MPPSWHSWQWAHRLPLPDHAAGAGQLFPLGPEPARSTSRRAEPAVELAAVSAVHDAVAVEVKEPGVSGLAAVVPERGAEGRAVRAVRVAVPVGVAEQPGEPGDVVAAVRAVRVTVQRAAPAVVHPAGHDGEG